LEVCQKRIFQLLENNEQEGLNGILKDILHNFLEERGISPQLLNPEFGEKLIGYINRVMKIEYESRRKK